MTGNIYPNKLFPPSIMIKTTICNIEKYLVYFFLPYKIEITMPANEVIAKKIKSISKTLMFSSGKTS